MINKKHNFEDVKAWQLARNFRKNIYTIKKNSQRRNLLFNKSNKKSHDFSSF